MRRAYKLHQLESILDTYKSKEKLEDINHILDLYAVFELLRDGNKPPIWNDGMINDYIEISKEFPKVVGVFASKITDENFLTIFENVDSLNKFDFWKFFNDYKIFNKISDDKFKELLNSIKSISYILMFRKTVEHYDECLSEYIRTNVEEAEVVLNKILSYDGNSTDVIIPKSLTPVDIVKLAENYIDLKEPNPNFLELIANSMSENIFPVTDDVKFKAKKAYQEYWEKAKQGMTFFSSGVEVSFKANLASDKHEEYKDNMEIYQYNSDWISQNLDYPTLLNNFIYLFGFTDICFRSCFTYRPSEGGFFESFFISKGKKDYSRNYVFNIKNMGFQLKLKAYILELKKHDIELEKVFEWFFKTYLREEFNVEGFLYVAPTNNTTYLEKCILLSASIDAVLKQFKMFQKYGQINRELFEMSSGHVSFDDISSLINNKYLYACSDDVKKEQNLLFSDQSLLTHTEKTEGRYNTLPHLLYSENLTKDDFYEYQVQSIEWLISRNSIYIDENGFMKPNTHRILILGDLYYNEVACYQYKKKYESTILELLKNKDLLVENSLLTVPEQQYLNYVLNKAKFGNGLDLRNKYVHGTFTLDINQQEKDYLELLKIMVLIIIKINEEFCLSFPNPEEI